MWTEKDNDLKINPDIRMNLKKTASRLLKYRAENTHLYIARKIEDVGVMISSGDYKRAVGNLAPLYLEEIEAGDVFITPDLNQLWKWVKDALSDNV